MTLPELRRDYQYGQLVREQLCPSPVEQFRQWFDELRLANVPEWFEINAMTLSTTTSAGTASSRIVLLKAFDEAGFTFFTNYRSDKAKQLIANPHASLNFFWPMFERQVRIEGTVVKTTSAVSDQYYQSRPVTSRLGAWVSSQSQPIPDDEPLEQRVEELRKKYPDDNIPRPDFWGGFSLRPNLFEFWQGKPSRLHDRFRYIRQEDQWTIHRLAP